ATVFADDEALDWEDQGHSDHERRFKRLGSSVMGRIILLVYTLRKSDDQETIRIISARQASRKERKAYSGSGDRF
ncbi:MAG TPA: hypothetical protein DCK99_17380, partial [Blastocatellia bacterium]|nr:hypothetical protein [Blastocatellia bacterium]